MGLREFENEVGGLTLIIKVKKMEVERRAEGVRSGGVGLPSGDAGPPALLNLGGRGGMGGGVRGTGLLCFCRISGSTWVHGVLGTLAVPRKISIHTIKEEIVQLSQSGFVKLENPGPPDPPSIHGPIIEKDGEAVHNSDFPPPLHQFEHGI